MTKIQNYLIKDSNSYQLCWQWKISYGSSKFKANIFKLLEQLSIWGIVKSYKCFENTNTGLNWFKVAISCMLLAHTYKVCVFHQSVKNLFLSGDSLSNTSGRKWSHKIDGYLFGNSLLIEHNAKFQDFWVKNATFAILAVLSGYKFSKFKVTRFENDFTQWNSL